MQEEYIRIYFNLNGLVNIFCQFPLRVILWHTESMQIQNVYSNSVKCLSNEFLFRFHSLIESFVRIKVGRILSSNLTWKFSETAPQFSYLYSRSLCNEIKRLLLSSYNAMKVPEGYIIDCSSIQNMNNVSKARCRKIPVIKYQLNVEI